MLASPATGPVDRVWYSFDGGTLYARTHSGKVFETSDYEVWTPSTVTAESVPQTAPPVARLPEEGARVVPAGFGRVYALGRQLFRSDDGGRTWVNLTAFKAESVIGVGQASVAVSNTNPNQVVAANQFGVWRSMDGGLSWAGLNQFLPNLPVKRILSTPMGATGTRIQAGGMGTMELPPGASVWTPVDDATADLEAATMKYYAARVSADVRAMAMSGTYVYLGTADGQILVSTDSGNTFNLTPTPASGPVERIWIYPQLPRVALVAVGGVKGPHVLRTVNTGGFWDALDSTLPNAPAHGVYGDGPAGAAYIATDQGVYWARVDLDAAGNPAVAWNRISESLPSAAATDVRLDPAGVEIYAAIDGYGVYASPAPHRARSFRVVNAADLTARPAAPGSLLSVVGGRVNGASAASLEYPVLAAADDASQIQVPFTATGPNVTLALATGEGQVQFGLQVQPVSPAIFVGLDGTPMLQDAESGLLLDAHNAAKPGARVQVFATGLGRVRPDWPTGTAAPMDNAPSVVANIRAFLNGTPLQVTKATLAPGFIGFYVVELQLPAVNNSGPNELYISADGVESNRVQLVIEQ